VVLSEPENCSITGARANSIQHNMEKQVKILQSVSPQDPQGKPDLAYMALSERTAVSTSK